MDSQIEREIAADKAGIDFDLELSLGFTNRLFIFGFEPLDFSHGSGTKSEENCCSRESMRFSAKETLRFNCCKNKLQRPKARPRPIWRSEWLRSAPNTTHALRSSDKPGNW